MSHPRFDRPASAADRFRTAFLAALLTTGWLTACDDTPSAVPRSPEPAEAAKTAAEAPAAGAARPAPPEQPGRWRRIPAHQLDATQDADALAMIRQLEAIGYAAGSIESDDDGTGALTRVERERSRPGHTFLTSAHAPEAYLIDANGRIVHSWRHAYPAHWPAAAGTLASVGPVDPTGQRRDAAVGFWRRARLLPNGHVLAIFDGLGLIEIDVDSNLVWDRANGAHHDLDLTEDGRILVLTREAHLVPAINPRVPILEDFIEVLDPAGTPLHRISVLEAFERSPWADIARTTYARGGDLLHINSLTRLEGRIADRLPAFRPGNVLISSFPLNVIAVVDLDLGAVVWLHSGGYRNQHDPQVLDNGNLVLFDNRGGHSGVARASTVLEFDPESGDERWAYRADPPNDFYSATCGAVQRLPDGNTLVTESDRGRAFEVAPDGDIVWEYRNPHRAGPDGRFIATLFEAWRVPEDFPLDWLPAPARREEAH